MHLPLRFKASVRQLGRRLLAVTRSFPRRLECNVCGWRGREFLSDGWHDNSACPRCDSLVRHRLLLATLMVPQQDALEQTFEDPSITTPERRERAYGISNHFRIYGTDFSALLAEHGFSVHTIDHRAFAPEAVRRHVLFPPTPSSHPLATNHRRDYLARKP